MLTGYVYDAEGRRAMKVLVNGRQVAHASVFCLSGVATESTDSTVLTESSGASYGNDVGRPRSEERRERGRTFLPLR